MLGRIPQLECQLFSAALANRDLTFFYLRRKRIQSWAKKWDPSLLNTLTSFLRKSIAARRFPFVPMAPAISFHWQKQTDSSSLLQAKKERWFDYGNGRHMMFHPFEIGFSGFSNTGKTTLITRLIDLQLLPIVRRIHLAG